MALHAKLSMTLGQDQDNGWRIVVSETQQDGRRSTHFYDQLDRCDRIEEVRHELTEMVGAFLGSL